MLTNERRIVGARQCEWVTCPMLHLCRHIVAARIQTWHLWITKPVLWPLYTNAPHRNAISLGSWDFYHCTLQKNTGFRWRELFAAFNSVQWSSGHYQIASFWSLTQHCTLSPPIQSSCPRTNKKVGNWLTKRPMRRRPHHQSLSPLHHQS